VGIGSSFFLSVSSSPPPVGAEVKTESYDAPCLPLAGLLNLRGLLRIPCEYAESPTLDAPWYDIAGDTTFVKATCREVRERCIHKPVMCHGNSRFSIPRSKRFVVHCCRMFRWTPWKLYGVFCCHDLAV
jgi:hypothetical protein